MGKWNKFGNNFGTLRCRMERNQKNVRHPSKKNCTEILLPFGKKNIYILIAPRLCSTSTPQMSYLEDYCLWSWPFPLQTLEYSQLVDYQNTS